jgi:hypothetical protein
MKKIAPKSLYIGQLIVLNKHTEAQVYTIAEIEDLIVTVMWFEGKRLCLNKVDASLCFYPDLQQIEYSINSNGRLATVRDRMEARLIAA